MCSVLSDDKCVSMLEDKCVLWCQRISVFCGVR